MFTSAALLTLFSLVAAAHPHPYSRLFGRPSLPLPTLPNVPPAPPLPSSPSPRTSPRIFCTPADPCWPSPSQWSDFNASLSGALLSVAPPLAPCFGFASQPPSPTLCAAAQRNFSDSYFRASLPGATQDVAWEADLATGAGCFAAPCQLGNTPPYAVRALTPAHIAAALAFASAHSLRVVVKSSGHEYSGRSSGAHALLLWTHALQGLTLHPAYSACPAAAAPPTPALSASPGTSFGQLYAAADAAGVTVVGGSEISVSACGGYTLGGGHSWQGPAFGMAVDNVLRFELVLANGSQVSASACEHPELFWALRGGGGGTFGVLTNCTYAAHPFPPPSVGATGAFLTVELLQGQQSFAVLMEGVLGQAEALGDPARSAGVVGGGYFMPTFAAPEGTHQHVSFLWGFNGTKAATEAALGPLAAYVAAHPEHLSLIGADLESYPSLMAFHEAFDRGSESTGWAGTLGSRLIPAALLRDPAARAAVAQVLAVIAYTTGGLTGQLVAGGAVAAGDAAATSLNPAWRGAALHFSYGLSWPLDTPPSAIAAAFANVTALTGLLSQAVDGGGSGAAYFSESDFQEAQWQRVFWGGNYERLQAVKAEVDPLGVFTCHHCVDLEPVPLVQ